MTAHIEPHEAQAILAAVRPAGPAAAPSAVEPRDFGRPLRLSARALEGLRRQVQGALRGCEQELARTLRCEITLELAELREVSAEGLFDALEQPFALAIFDVGGQPAWARWEISGAVAAIECRLGMQPSQAQDRSLSAVEQRFLLELLESIVVPLAEALGSSASAGRVVADAEDAGAWTDGGAGSDRARLRMHLVCNGLAAPSGIDVWLPGVAGDAAAEDCVPQSLPRHLDDVDVWVSARLGSRDVPLSELLAIEAGDVIALETAVDGSLEVLAEDVPCARARLGCSAGKIALQIEVIGSLERGTA